MSGWSTLQRAALCTVELSCLRKVPFPSASSVMWPSPRGEEAYRALNQRLWALESDGLAPHLLRQQTREQTAAVKEEMEPVWQRVQRAQYTSDTAYAKHERYCRDQRVLLRQLADLTAYERPMHVLPCGLCPRDVAAPGSLLPVARPYYAGSRDPLCRAATLQRPSTTR